MNVMDLGAAGRLMRLEQAMLALIDELKKERARIAGARELLGRAHLAVPCTCDKAYLERDLNAPDCPWHQYVEDLVDELRLALEGAE